MARTIAGITERSAVADGAVGARHGDAKSFDDRPEPAVVLPVQ
jgi:hypothetical protein